MTNQELLAETSIRLNETGEDFYRDMRLVLQGSEPEPDFRVLIGTAQTCADASIITEDKIYFLYALNFLQNCVLKRVVSELKGLRDDLQDAAWDADLADDS